VVHVLDNQHHNQFVWPQTVANPIKRDPNANYSARDLLYPTYYALGW